MLVWCSSWLEWCTFLFYIARSLTLYYFKIFFCSLIIFRWGYDKFPKEKPLVFFKGGKPIHPLEMLDGFKVVVESMVAHIEKAFPKKTLKFWRLQSPRHFHGGDWNQNGSCLFDNPLEELQVCNTESFHLFFGFFVLHVELLEMLPFYSSHWNRHSKVKIVAWFLMLKYSELHNYLHNWSIWN